MRKRLFQKISLITIAFLLSLFLCACSQKENPFKIGVSYKEIIKNLDHYIKMSKSSDVNGERRYLGQTSDKLVILEIIGNKTDVSTATLITGIPSDAPDIALRNTGILLIFIKNIFPEWEDASSWASTALQNVISADEIEETVHGDRLIKMYLMESTGLICVSVKHKDKYHDIQKKVVEESKSTPTISMLIEPIDYLRNKLIGKTKGEVRQLVGNPDRIEFYAGKKCWIYGHSYTNKDRGIVFEGDKVLMVTFY